MKCIVLALFCLLASMPAFAVDPETPNPATTVSSVEILFMPSKKDLTEAFNSSGLSTAKGVVLVAYDKTGKILGVKLDKPTGSPYLDTAIMAWAAQVKLKATSSGISSMPFEFSSHK